jgi:hypothetical protein
MSTDDAEAVRQIRQWNDAAVARNGGIVISPNGELDDETKRLIAIAEKAGKRVEIITRRR